MACLRIVAFFALLCAVASAAEQAKRPPQDANHDYHDHQDHHGNHNPNYPVDDTKTNDLTRGQNYHGLNNPNFPVNSEEERKFYKPYFFHPYFHHPLHNPHPAPENLETEEVADSTEAPEKSETEEVTDSIEAPENPETEEVADSTEASATDDESQQTPPEPYDRELTDSETNQEENKVSDTGNVREDIDQTGEQDAETPVDEAVPFDDVESRMESRNSYEVPCDFLSVPRYSCYTCYTYLVCKPEGGKVKACSDVYAPYCNNGLAVTAAASTLERKHPPHQENDHNHHHGPGHNHPAAVPETPDDLSNPDEPSLDNEAEIPEESLIDLELEDAEGSADEEITVERNLHRQRRHLPQHHDHQHEHNHGHDHGHPETLPEELRQESENEVEDEENVADLKRQENVEEEENITLEEQEEIVEVRQENENEVEDEENVADQKRQENVEEEENITLEEQEEIVEESLEIEDEASASLKQVQWVTCDNETTPLFSCYDCYSRLRCKYPIGGRVIPCYSPVKPYCNNGICSAIPSDLCTSIPAV
ncbi:Uncharacterized protein OBRU01_11048 [Operophtera brumata]|uniref:Uncharacterized protein n=1 Tax=Operophtera brumata TaxID=104452 RepID=A0A0L7LD52_OPEBR|nr:Uncharacterized protein OBRU01_11048 [Operophtera brumata]